MAERPTLLIDVDGVLNPGRHRGAGFTVHQLQPTGWTRTLSVALNPAHGAMLLEFAAANGVELVWATTWVDDANTMIGPVIGLPELPVVPIPMLPRRGPDSVLSIGAWKAQHVAAWAGLQRRFVWLDDEHNVASQLEKRRKAGEVGAHLVIQVSPKSGLRDRHLAKAAQWFAQNGTPASCHDAKEQAGG
ncbi:HAD domain-containing protein [Actinocorallia populi]|uniref:HAD domain-containing protein n=1 Tax=Actinocorallia populi TaxID=2079200 RepID=UPI000D08C1D4|nr:HAD domain-containing protein [Actinocorallia populi]